MDQDLRERGSYWPVATLYVFPTKDEAADFSSKLSPLIKDNLIARSKEYNLGTWALLNRVRRINL